MAVNCEWNDWPVDWSVCTQDCGGGTQTKSRTIRVQMANNGQECEGDTDIVQACNTTACADGKGL